jgi:hypothetical protein
MGLRERRWVKPYAGELSRSRNALCARHRGGRDAATSVYCVVIATLVQGIGQAEGCLVLAGRVARFHGRALGSATLSRTGLSVPLKPSRVRGRNVAPPVDSIRKAEV